MTLASPSGFKVQASLEPLNAWYKMESFWKKMHWDRLISAFKQVQGLLPTYASIQESFPQTNGIMLQPLLIQVLL